MESTMTSMPAEPLYPLTLNVPRPEKQSRLTNFPVGIGSFIRFILAIPHFVVLMLLGLVAGVVGLIASFGILFTGNYPKGLFDFVLGVQRWGVNVSAYLYHMRDEYPPFSTEAGKYAAGFDIAYPDHLNRFLNFPLIGFYIKGLLVIPHIIVLYFLYLAGFVVLFIAEFAILFTGSFPEGMHSFIVGILRWNQRVSAYVSFMTDKYPPFSLK
jgi:hypothetical protein